MREGSPPVRVEFGFIHAHEQTQHACLCHTSLRHTTQTRRAGRVGSVGKQLSADDGAGTPTPPVVRYSSLILWNHQRRASTQDTLAQLAHTGPAKAPHALASRHGTRRRLVSGQRRLSFHLIGAAQAAAGYVLPHKTCVGTPPQPHWHYCPVQRDSH